jgi:pyruvate kinase
MSISNTSSEPTLSGGTIDLAMICHPTNVGLRRTKIICTLGPACWKVDQLETLMDAGMDMARFNFSHGDHVGHAATLERLRTAARNKKQNIGTFVPFRSVPIRWCKFGDSFSLSLQNVIKLKLLLYFVGMLWFGFDVVSMQ